MADALANARARKEELLEELRQIDQFISLYLHFSADETTERVTNTASPQSEPPPVESPDGDVANGASDASPAAGQRRAVRGRPNAIADAAADLIRESGQPLTRGQLVEALEARGVALESTDKAKYVGTIMWRHKDRFTNTDDGYALAEWGNQGKITAEEEGESDDYEPDPDMAYELYREQKLEEEHKRAQEE